MKLHISTHVVSNTSPLFARLIAAMLDETFPYTHLSQMVFLTDCNKQGTDPFLIIQFTSVEHPPVLTLCENGYHVRLPITPVGEHDDEDVVFEENLRELRRQIQSVVNRIVI